MKIFQLIITSAEPEVIAPPSVESPIRATAIPPTNTLGDPTFMLGETILLSLHRQ
jgi:hypothetical protein